jgi:hypothetical protein
MRAVSVEPNDLPEFKKRTIWYDSSHITLTQAVLNFELIMRNFQHASNGNAKRASIRLVSGSFGTDQLGSSTNYSTNYITTKRYVAFNEIASAKHIKAKNSMSQQVSYPNSIYDKIEAFGGTPFFFDHGLVKKYKDVVVNRASILGDLKKRGVLEELKGKDHPQHARKKEDPPGDRSIVRYYIFLNNRQLPNK